MSDDKKSKYLVGYGKPPLETRFRKGQSGNVRGRPKASFSIESAFSKALRAPVRIVENGHRKVISRGEAIIIQLINKAMSGDLKAMRQALDLIKKFGLDRVLTSETQTGGVFICLPANGRESDGTPIYKVDIHDRSINLNEQKPAYIVGDKTRGNKG